MKKFIDIMKSISGRFKVKVKVKVKDSRILGQLTF